MAICYVLVEDFDADAEITAQVTTSNGGSTRDTVRIRLANTVIRLDVTAAVDLIDVVTAVLAEIGEAS